MDRRRAHKLPRRVAELEQQRSALPRAQWLARLAQFARDMDLADEAGAAIRRRLMDALRVR